MEQVPVNVRDDLDGTGKRRTGDGRRGFEEKVDGFVVGEVTALSRYVVPFFSFLLLFCPGYWLCS